MQRLLTVCLLCGHFFLFNTTNALAKVKKEKAVQQPACTKVGEASCLDGYKPTCPPQYKPTCIFVGKEQLPGCLADSSDTTAFNYRLDKISCKKEK